MFGTWVSGILNSCIWVYGILVSGIRQSVCKKVLGLVGEKVHSGEKLHGPEIKAILQPANFCLTSPTTRLAGEQDNTLTLNIPSKWFSHNSLFKVQSF